MSATVVAETRLPDNLADWLSFLEARRPEHHMVLGLERASRVAHQLLPAQFFTPERTTKVITVGGTNGKGSTVATLTALFQAAGLRIGAWTSPHLLTFNERIRIDGKMVADHEISDAFARIESLRGEDFLSYFEFGALAALDIFVRREVDVIVLEVGLGGRLDAVNIVDADVSIVTTVDLDHQAFLGDTVEQIAVEKAGIFRSHRPAICGEAEPVSTLLTTLAEKQSLPFIRGEAFELDESRGATEGVMAFSGKDADGCTTIWQNLPVPPLPLTSVACALQAFLLLCPEVSQQSVQQGLGNTRLAGRCQELNVVTETGRRVTVLMDVAHNPQAARYLAKRLDAVVRPMAVLGMLNDKDLHGVIAPLHNRFRHWYVATVDFPARARSGADLQRELELAGEPVSCHDSVAKALGAAFAAIDKDGCDHTTVVVFGSFHTVAEALTVLNVSLQ